MSNKKLPAIFSISMLPSISLDNEHALNRLLDTFERFDQLLPTHWGHDERIRLVYSKEEVLEKTLSGETKFSEIHLHRSKQVEYSGSFSLHYSFRCFLEFTFKSMPQSLWPFLFELSDSIAEIVKPRYGATHMFWPSTLPWTTDQERFHRWMNFCAQPAPVNFGPVGPLGLAQRTYFGEELMELIGKDVVLKTPAIVDEKEYGAVQIDIVEKPWESTPEQLLQAWLPAMEHLQKTEVLAIPEFNYKDNRTVNFTVNNKWEQFIKDYNK